MFILSRLFGGPLLSRGWHWSTNSFGRAARSLVTSAEEGLSSWRPPRNSRTAGKGNEGRKDARNQRPHEKRIRSVASVWHGTWEGAKMLRTHETAALITQCLPARRPKPVLKMFAQESHRCPWHRCRQCPLAAMSFVAVLRFLCQLILTHMCCEDITRESLAQDPSFPLVEPAEFAR